MARAVLRGRGELPSAGRVVVKVGSSSLTTAAGALDGDRLVALVEALAARRLAGADVVLVSSGSIAAGLSPLGLARRPRDLATQQAAASVGQGRLVARYTAAFHRHAIPVGQILLTAEDVVRRTHYRNAQRTLYRLLRLGVVPVVNENDTVATHEIRFGDNDRLAALVAHLVHADALVLLSDVDALYDGPPSRPGARRIERVRRLSELDQVDIGSAGSSVGTGGMVTKIEACRIATSSGIPVLLTSADNVQDALAGKPVGTWFDATGRRTPTRLLWLAHAANPLGELVLDPGAIDAVVKRRASLLPAGVVAVRGAFEARDPVNLCDETGHVHARGLVNYSSSELPGLLGRSTRELVRSLGKGYDKELVHRDDLVLLAP
jgi:glutamate 5-kinase